MGKAQNMAKIAVSGNGLIPATNLAAGAAIANLGLHLPTFKAAIRLQASKTVARQLVTE